MAIKQKIKNSFEKRVKTFWQIVIPLIAYCGLAGIFTGIIVGLFNYTANFLTSSSAKIYSYVYAHPMYVPLVFLGLAILALAMGLIHSRIPEIRGSGIPQTEGVMRGFFTFKWLRILISTIVCSFISFFAGLSLGSEGPSVQIGATTAQGASKLLGARMAWTRHVISGGAGAGLAVAFNAPLTGIIFVLEEGHKRFSSMILISAFTSVIFGTFTYRLMGRLTGLWPENAALFNFGQIPTIPYTQVGILVAIGVVCGISALLFNYLFNHSQEVLDKYTKQFPYKLRLLIVFMLTGVLGFVFPYANGGGHSLIENVTNLDFSVQMLLLILVIKFLMMLFCFNSGATGGLFIPMLAIGALIGGVVGHLFINLNWMDPTYYKAVVCICMTTFFGASVRAPITAIVLIVEITRYNSNFLSTSISIFTAFLIAELFSARPLYETMLLRFRRVRAQGRVVTKELIEIEVPRKAFIVERQVADVLWPADSLVIKVKRGNQEIVPDGETVILEGDILTIQTETYDVKDTKKYLRSLIVN